MEHEANEGKRAKEAKAKEMTRCALFASFGSAQGGKFRLPWSAASFIAFIKTLLLFVFFTSNASAQNAPVGTFIEAVVQVVFVDEQDSEHISLDRLQQAGQEIHDFFHGLSYGKLDFQTRFTQVHLPKTYVEFQAQSLVDQRADVTTAALVNDPDFFTDAKGLAVLMLIKYGTLEDTWMALSDWPNISQKIAHSTIKELSDPIHPPGPSQVVWGGWAHEFGHQLEVYGSSNLVVSGTWIGHPSGYISGYDLMDSCYPCHQSGFGLLGTPLVTDQRTVFPGWLDGSHVVIVPKPVGPSGQTFVMPPLSQNIADPVVQVVKIPVDSKRYYMVQVRQRINTDALQAASPLGIHSEGVQIQLVDEDADIPVKVCVRNPNPGCWSDYSTTTWPYLLWTVGDTFQDQAQKIKVGVIGAVAGGFEINVTRDVPPNHPDLFVTPWLTPPSNSYETVDIWVDSSCNGYEEQGGSLKYGRRADGTVIGNGDDPCINHENGVYATIHNIGDAEAPATTATFEVSSPLGVGVTGSWTTLGTVSVPAISKDQSTNVHVTWTPSVNLTPQQIEEKHFQLHSCVRVNIATASGEIVTSNNSAQENISVFEAVAQSGQIGGTENYKMPPMSGSFKLTNSFVATSVALARIDVGVLRTSFVSLKPSVDKATWTAYAENLEANLVDLHRRVQTGGYRALPSRGYIRKADGLEEKIVRAAVVAIIGGGPSIGKQTFVLHTISQLPDGWTYEVNHGQLTVELDIGETREIPVQIKPSDSPVGKIFNLQVGAFTQLTLQNPKSKHLSWYRAGGVTLSAHPVLPSQVSISGTQIAFHPPTGRTLVRAKGALQPPRPGAIVTIDFYGEGDRVASRRARAKTDGSFSTRTVRLPFRPTGVRAIWQGDITYESAVASAAIASQ